MTVKAGRTFADRDSATGQQVVIVNQAFAKKYLRQQVALGTHLALDATPSEIVGLVADTPQNSGAGNFGPLSATPTVYVPTAQTGDRGISMLYTWFSPSWVVRTRGANGNLIGEMQAAMQAIDPRLPFSTFKSMQELQDSSVAGQRYEATLFSIFAALALLLAAVGISGLIVGRKRPRCHREYRNSRLPTFAYWLIRGLIWGVQPHDARTYVVVTALMFAIAASASLLPALRLIKLDPAQALRDE